MSIEGLTEPKKGVEKNTPEMFKAILADYSIECIPWGRWLITRAVLNLPQAVFLSYMKKVYISHYCVWFYLISHDISQRDTILFSGNLVGGSSVPLLFRTLKTKIFPRRLSVHFNLFVRKNCQRLTQFDLSKCNVLREFEYTRMMIALNLQANTEQS